MMILFFFFGRLPREINKNCGGKHCCLLQITCKSIKMLQFKILSNNILDICGIVVVFSAIKWFIRLE